MIGRRVLLGRRQKTLLCSRRAELLNSMPHSSRYMKLDHHDSTECRRLPLNSEPVPMSLLEFGQRAFDRDGVSISGVPIVLTGFVAGFDNDGFLLARYQIACCAADAAPVVVRVVDVDSEQPPRDQWVMVTGLLHPGAVDTPELSAATVLAITPPEDPYETG